MNKCAYQATVHWGHKSPTLNDKLVVGKKSCRYLFLREKIFFPIYSY